MDVFGTQFLDNDVEGKIFLFFGNHLQATIERHYHVCIHKTTDDYYYLIVCTSDREHKRRRRASLLGLEKTLVPINPNELNGLTCLTFAECSAIQRVAKTELIKHFNNSPDGRFYTGDVDFDILIQIAMGLDNDAIPQGDILLLREKYDL